MRHTPWSIMIVPVVSDCIGNSPDRPQITEREVPSSVDRCPPSLAEMRGPACFDLGDSSHES